MEISASEYKGKKIRFLKLSDNGLLLNTKDVCVVLGINERTAGTPLSQPCLDLASAVSIAGASDIDFAMWLNETFAGYNVETILHPRCDEEWGFY